jgi:S-methylmethionine-dependent homocysteine/selenocysteine methylase
MAKYRNALPQLSGTPFLTDGGMETTMIFHEGIPLPHFAVFDLLRTADGVKQTRAYYDRYAAMATAHGVGFILECPTWRANADWGDKLGYSRDGLAEANRRAVVLMADIRARHETPKSPIVISGAIGPRGDGYVADRMMSADDAQDYHSAQVNVFRSTEADMVSAFTINYVEEAIGIVRAAKTAAMPVVISFTLETDGRLPSGASLQEAIETVDAATGSSPIYYMINCAHPTHFEDVLKPGARWVHRIRGLRANASKRSHAELDACSDLDVGNPEELGHEYQALRRKLPQLTVFGGCCGTDHRHVEQIAQSCLAAA